VMLHRTILGSIERFIGILIEHFAGAFPAWIAPVQVKLLTITERCDEWAREMAGRLRAEGIRVEMDLRNEKIGFKIREAQMEKPTYMLIMGDKEVEKRTVAVRSLKDGDLGAMQPESFIARLLEEVRTKAR